jgi:hypothetical protein
MESPFRSGDENQKVDPGRDYVFILIKFVKTLLLLLGP